MVGLGQHPQLGQLVRHRLTVVSGPAVDDPTALLTPTHAGFCFSLKMKPALNINRMFRTMCLYEVLRANMRRRRGYLIIVCV